jgi:hypothetical protein
MSDINHKQRIGSYFLEVGYDEDAESPLIWDSANINFSDQLRGESGGDREWLRIPDDSLVWELSYGSGSRPWCTLANDQGPEGVPVATYMENLATKHNVHIEDTGEIGDAYWFSHDDYAQEFVINLRECRSDLVGFKSFTLAWLTPELLAEMGEYGRDPAKIAEDVQFELAAYESWMRGDVYEYYVSDLDGEVVDHMGDYYEEDNAITAGAAIAQEYSTRALADAEAVLANYHPPLYETDAAIKGCHEWIADRAALPLDKFAQKDLLHEMCAARQAQAHVGIDTDEDQMIVSVLKDLGERFDIVTGRVTGEDEKLDEILASAQIEHEGDAGELQELQNERTIYANALTVEALTKSEDWLLSFTSNNGDREEWEFDTVARIADYRERWNITDPLNPLGSGALLTAEQAKERDLLTASYGLEPKESVSLSR